MADQTSGVAAGTLSGINLSGDDEAPEAALPPEDERTADAPTTPVDEPPAPADPDPEPEPDDEPDPANAAAVEAPAPPETETGAEGGDGGDQTPPPAPPATDEPSSKAKAKAKGAPARPYVVLKEEQFDDGKVYYTRPEDGDGKPIEVEARNAQNAMRRAFKDLSGGNETEATLVVIPASMFRPTPVRLSKTERVSVSFG